MSLNSKDSFKESKRLKQLSLFEIFGKQSKKRKLSADKDSSSSETSKRLLTPKDISAKIDAETSQLSIDAEHNDKSIDLIDNSTDAVKKKFVKITGNPTVKNTKQQINQQNIHNMNDMHLSGIGETKLGDKPGDLNIATMRDRRDCVLGGEVSSIQEVTNECHSESKKVFHKEFPTIYQENPINGRDQLKVKRLCDSPKHSQDSDDLYETIMQEKREANRRLLKKEVKEDSDLSQETPPRAPLTFPQAVPKVPDSETMNIYDSPDMFETFPSQDFEDDFQDENDIITWLGKPKSRLKLAPDCLLPLPHLEETKHHTVLFDTSYFDLGPPPPSQNVYKDCWDSDHVKLPCSPKSLYPSPHGKSLTNRWELIETALYNDINDSKKLETSIMRYNSRFSHTFSALHCFFRDCLKPSERNQFFSITLPKMVDLALSLPNLITQPIPLLRRQRAHCVSLSQQQIACLLANAFFCTFPRRNSSSPTAEYANYPSINFNRLFTSNMKSKYHMQKMRTLIHYFQRITEEMPSGIVTFERRVSQDFPVWNRSPCKLCDLHIRMNGLIEDEGKGMLQMDFANKYVGGGVLGGGMVQEEILFCICPEFIVSRLFTEVLDDNECLIISGVERFSAYSGYAQTYKWSGDFVDLNTRDSWRRKISCTVALDATQFSNGTDQYRPGNVRRELNKLYTGFRCDVDPDYAPAIATGNWGCGAFRGDPILKSLLQLMAAAVVGRELCYFTFNDESLMNTIYEMYEFIKASDLHVGDLWNTISKYNEEVVAMVVKQKQQINENIFDFMKRLNRDYQTSTDEGDSSPEKMSEEW